ncbi:hypothetical protein PFISCL1PPCAC_27516, partial [Pristionchus fissidentatus]
FSSFESVSSFSMRLSRLIAWLLLVSILDWVDGQDQNSFNDATSKQVFTLGFYSTSGTPQVCVPKTSPGWQVLSVVTAQGEKIFGQAMAVVSVSESLKMVNVHFRGAESMTTFVFSGYTYLLQSDFPVQLFEGISVASEFAKTFTALWQGGLRTAMNSAWDEYCDFPILISGDSVGGCPAQMLAVKMKLLGMWDKPKISVYAYKSPRCGYQQFAMAVEASSSITYQIRHNEIVFNYPPTACTALNPASPQNCFWHAGYGLQYNKGLFGTTGPVRCANAELAACKAGSILNILNHNGFHGMSYGIIPPTC